MKGNKDERLRTQTSWRLPSSSSSPPHPSSLPRYLRTRLSRSIRSHHLSTCRFTRFLDHETNEESEEERSATFQPEQSVVRRDESRSIFRLHPTRKRKTHPRYWSPPQSLLILLPSPELLPCTSSSGLASFRVSRRTRERGGRVVVTREVGGVVGSGGR